MKHDLQTFSRDIAALIKTSGDSGGSGDKSEKSLQHNDYFVPTRETMVSPLKNEWGQSSPTTGDRKAKRFETVGPSVPSVPTATTNIQAGRAARIFGDNPVGWHAISEELKQMPEPEWAGADRWSQMIGDAHAFLSAWDAAAHDLGWTALDLFGVHPVAPGCRYDVMGLVMLLGGGSVVALTDQAAAFRRPSGSTLTYRRKPMSNAVILCGAQHAIR
ncbi:hypothetical protein [Bradyrhizobium canariense]|uniref:Uncharacterized protein n=1 Tax=Bradyrhizobium canariense TaxID=255045 RepID=A0A1X3GFK6_9BRAD|nr:hypothetical protein [Bradyrhizobium canariense]OSI70481.1 hypothetical protein BSZ22_14770 [Bradyrhizobium canariense]OSI75316.1 hypothetical protein BSZ23_29380 [Bradyrhizobium canariense]OSI85846.1 hypothetical protein BSZ25_31600 [Bradyrhizobium canariense]OSI88225.1 hypothetical protein BSZ24_24960 [Bradyrhizobium canariense]OSI99050.1 hypothetical protein BSZ16_30810 [Bradyrhizobium canariense]